VLKATKLPREEAWIKKGGDCYVVRCGERIVGLLEKYRGRGYPWKVFAGYGHDARLVAFTDNGKAAAVALLEHEMEKATHTVFVYGTLRSGERNNKLLRRSELLGEATIGGTLYSFGGFPGLRLAADGGLVVGEVWRVNDRTLARLDELEGVDSGFYSRLQVTVELGGSPVTAWVYEAASRLVDGLPVIAGGDWCNREAVAQ